MADDSGGASEGSGLPRGGRGTWDGHAVVFATDPAECGAFFAELSEVLRRSRRTVLIRLSRPARRLGARWRRYIRGVIAIPDSVLAPAVAGPFAGESRSGCDVSVAAGRRSAGRGTVSMKRVSGRNCPLHFRRSP
jgi:hypothetical protein